MSTAEIGPGPQAADTHPIPLPRSPWQSEPAAGAPVAGLGGPPGPRTATEPVTVSDTALAVAAADDPAAFAAIYDRYGDRLHDFCLGMLRDRDAAADAVRDTFTTAATRLTQLRKPDKLRPWLYAIARHEALRRIIRGTATRGTHRHLPDHANPEAGPEELALAHVTHELARFDPPVTWRRRSTLSIGTVKRSFERSEGHAGKRQGWWALLRELPYLVVALGVAVPVVVSVWASASAGRVATNRLFTESDDAFYYFTIASRWVGGQGSTFDGVHATNGYQPLWGWLTSAIFAVTRGEQASAAAVVTVSALLWLVSVVLARAIAGVLGAPGAGAVALAVTALVIYRTWFDGMELPLVAVATLAMMWVTLRSEALTPAGPRQRHALVLGVLGALAVLSRLDAAAFVVLLGGAIMARVHREFGRRVRLAALLLGPAVATLLVYAAVEFATFGSAVPVSGVAKQLGDGKPHWATIGDFLTLSFGGRVHAVGLLLLVAVSLALLVRHAPQRFRRHWQVVDAAGPVTELLIVATAAQLVQVAYYTATSSWGGETWYYGLVATALFVAVTVVLGSLGRLARRLEWVPQLAVTVVVVLVVARLALETAAFDEPADTRETAIAATTAAAAWADTMLPPAARLAMGDWAGGFAFGAHRSVVQTEGLVDDVGYLDALSGGHGGQYLDSAGVDYYVKIGDQTGVDDGPGCERFTEPIYGRGATVHVRVCDTDLVHTTPGPSEQGDVRIWRVRASSFKP